jgi:hypothetical protein
MGGDPRLTGRADLWPLYPIDRTAYPVRLFAYERDSSASILVKSA